MLNELFNKIESLFSKKNDKSTEPKQTDNSKEIQDYNEQLTQKVQQIYQVFVPLAEIEPNLHKDVVMFIFEGNNPEVLLKLQQLPDDKALALLACPGTYNWFSPTYNLTKNQEKLAQASHKARHTLYGYLFEYLSNEQIIRYAKILDAATQQRNFTAIHEQIPSWFIYLIIDALVTTYDDHGFKQLNGSKLLKQNWTHQKLFNLLESDEKGTGEHYLSMLFERKNIESYYSDRLEKIFNFTDTHEFIQPRLEQLGEIIPPLSVNGQSIFLNYITKQKDLFIQIPKLIVQLAIGKSKTIREKATSSLSLLKPEDSQKYLQDFLLNGQSKERSYAAELLARLGEHNVKVLEHALAEEKQKSVQQVILSSIQRLQSMATVDQELSFEIPEFTPIIEQKIPESFTEIILDNYQQILAKAEQSATNEIEENKSRDYKYDWAQKNLSNLKKVKSETLKSVVSQINGETARKSFGNDEQIINLQKKIQNYSEFSIIHALRIIVARRNSNYIYWESLFDLLKPEHYIHLELRQLAQALKQTNFNNPNRLIAQGMLADWNELFSYFTEPEQVWPFFAENMAFLTEALGLSPSLEENSYRSFSPAKAIEILSYFPALPQQFIPRLLELALGENKRLRVDAQQALQNLPDIHLRAIEALESGKQEIRITAIEWLARLQHQAAIPALNTLLNKEKKEVVRAALLTALEKLGQDISSYLSPDVLLKEAEQGLKTKLSSSLAWFDFSTLPQVKWHNGKSVDPQIIQWWTILAEKLKEPKANELLQLYVALLDSKSQQQLANHLLHQFIHQDTRGPTLEEATAIAVKEAPSRLKNYQDWYKRYPEYYAEYANATLEQIIEEIKRAQLATYLGSAIKSKGLLALTNTAQGSFAVKQLQDYMKQHYPRRAQIEAMISALSMSNDPLIIQLLLSLSRRYRTTSVQSLANTLVSEIAERNQWSNDELADRTIPTAGLDENGILNLQYGERNFSAIVDAKDKFILKNEDGKEIKALPAARQNDDETLIKEAKALFSTSKKEFKQVVDMQTGRLYEAMCSERQWNVAEWQEYIFEHPIMKRLIQRLVWIEVKIDGEKVSFRPSDDGALLNLDDDEIELSSESKIQISHAVLVGTDEAQAWIEHFKDYKVQFLFEQMTHHLPNLENPKATQINDHKGWLTDTYTLRGVITKLGYQRSSIEDGGSFDRYTKSYNQLDLDVQITFSGSYVPEENIPAVLYELEFEKQGKRSWSNSALLLNDIPPILLAESYADYLKIAEACSGFDPEWEKKTPW